jgi:molybdate transport system regulatory protein
VETSRGGRRQGGANLTAAGEEVLARYRRMELLTRKAIAKEMRKLKSLLRDMAK